MSDEENENISRHKTLDEESGMISQRLTEQSSVIAKKMQEWTKWGNTKK